MITEKTSMLRGEIYLKDMKDFQRNLCLPCIKEIWPRYIEDDILGLLFHSVFVLLKQTNYYPE